MSVVDRLVENNERLRAGFDAGDLAPPPAMPVAVVTCMDARIDPFRALGVEIGQVHVLRNAGGVVTDDTVRSLTISQRLLGTREIMVVLHTDCGMMRFTDDELRGRVEAETGVRPPFAFESFTDLDDEVRQSSERLRRSPFLLHREAIRGFVYDVATGALREVVGASGRTA